MVTPLLMTKFIIPPTRPYQVEREQLLDILDDSLESRCKLSLICAPTGYGKTTLVSQWISRYRERISRGAIPSRRFFWLQLDQEDNDLARFITYLVTALEPHLLDIGQGALAAIQNIRSTSPHILATLLINDLSRLTDQIVLTLEDYHTIHLQPIQEFMGYLVDHQPQQMHLVIISRGDPPLPLASLRAQGQLTEVRQLDLAMTEAEANVLLTKIVQPGLSAEQIHQLWERTEGWVAGLQLAVLSMRQAANIPDFINSFSGGHEYIADYLTDEVLEQQSEETRNFLLQTSILKQLSAPLCETVANQPQAALILKKLADDNIFLIPLDDQAHWYRYHALFADLLRKRLQQSGKELLAILHRRAGQWYAQNQMLDQAVEHQLLGEDYAEAASLIGENAERILLHGQILTFLHWLDAFPVNQLYVHPRLIVYQGVALMLLGKIPETALSTLQEIASTTGKYLGESNTLQALYFLLKGNGLESIRLSEIALQQLPAESAYLRILAADNLAMAYAMRGDIGSAIRAFGNVVEASQKAGNVIMMLIALTNIAGLHYQQGNLRQAWDGYQQVLDISRHQLKGDSQPLGRALLGMGELAREWNDLDNAYSYLTAAADIFRQFIDIGVPIANLSLVRVCLSQGDFDKAQTILEEARKHSLASKTTKLDDRLVDLMQVRMWIAMGYLKQVEQWAEDQGLLDRPLDDFVAQADSNATAFEVIQGEYLTLVRFFLAKNEPNKVFEILKVIISYNENRAQIRRVIEALVLQALAHQEQGDEDELTMQSFSKALKLAEPEGYRRTFLDEGQPVARLLERAIASNVSPSYSRSLLTDLTGQMFPPPKNLKKSGSYTKLVEPLSEREVEVLGLLSEGLTNQQIGSRLHISLSTVKGHTTNIYGKLGVKTRTQAIAIARRLGLLT